MTIYDKYKKDIFSFNHIDTNINKEKLSEIKPLYSYGLKKFWSYKQGYKYFKRWFLAINITSSGLIAWGSTAGALTLNSIMLGTIWGAGLLPKTFSEIKNYKDKNRIG